MQVKPIKAQLLKSNSVKTVPSLLLLSKHESALHVHTHLEIAKCQSHSLFSVRFQMQRPQHFFRKKAEFAETT